MTDPLQGLRFDIYERVHLPDDVAAIEALEEIELVPHMQAQSQDDQVLLKGHLLLSGVYRPQDSADGAAQLEHWIPVEISLPLNRVEKVEDLTVEIDNFDVDLLSARSLNVTGVLALRGLQVAAQQLPVWRDDSFTVVHQAPVVSEAADSVEEQERTFEGDATPQVEPAVWTTPEARTSPEAEALSDMLEVVQPETDSAEPMPASEHSAPYFPTSLARESGIWPIDYQEQDPPAAAPQPLEDDLEQWIRTQEAEIVPAYETGDSQSVMYGVNDAPEQTGWGDMSTVQPEPSVSVEAGVNDAPEQTGWADMTTVRPEPGVSVEDAYVPVPEEKPEMKVALGVKPLETPSVAFTGVSLLSQLGDKGAVREAELQAMRSAQAETEAAEAADSKSSRASTGDDLEWTRLFLSKGADVQAFRKVKMCIVQREDTLEAIAARYNVQTRQLQLHNRLSDPYLSAGQVLYIP